MTQSEFCGFRGDFRGGGEGGVFSFFGVGGGVDRFTAGSGPCGCPVTTFDGRIVRAILAVRGCLYVK